MPRTILLAGVAAVLFACAGSGGIDYEEYAEAPTFLRQEIEERIKALPYQSGENLLSNIRRLTYIGEPAIPFLLDALEEGEVRARCSAAYVLGLIRDRRTIEPLRDALTDDSPVVRYEVATSLCAMGEPAGYPTLIRGLEDEDIRNRYKAHEALKLLTKNDFGYRHDDAPDERSAAVQRWQSWFDRLQDAAL